jgi:DNA replication and repair protein RecF
VPLERLRVESLRCLLEVELALDPERNYLFGPNGAGKTSILEAIYVLGRGRSFRTRETRRLVRRGSSAFSVYGETVEGGDRHRLGVGYGAAGLEVRLDRSPVRGMAALAGIFPVHVVDPSLHQLIEGGPSERRRFIDWGVFHVEPPYLEAWRRYRRVLSQRNAALKRGASAGELRPWTESLAEAGVAVDGSRGQYVDRLSKTVEEMGRRLLDAKLVIEYRRGWGEGKALAAALSRGEARDRALGSTQVGPHRADLRIGLGWGGVREEASRGQQKLAAAALILSQVALFAEDRGSGGTLLIDDPAAELDADSVRRLLRVVEELPAQRIITGLSESQLPPREPAPVFHVEQGKVQRVL